jgi:hypothetical protein
MILLLNHGPSPTAAGRGNIPPTETRHSQETKLFLNDVYPQHTGYTANQATDEMPIFHTNLTNHAPTGTLRPSPGVPRQGTEMLLACLARRSDPLNLIQFMLA